MKNSNIEIIDLWDHLLINPSEISTGSNTPYTVYGPFFKKFKGHLDKVNFGNEEDRNFKFEKLKDLDEDIEVLTFYPAELDNLIASGQETLDAKTVTAWFRAKQFLKI